MPDTPIVERVEAAFSRILKLHEDAVVCPAQAFEARGAFVGLVEGDGPLESADADAEVLGEVSEDGVVVAGAGIELLLRDAFADRPVAFGERLGGSAFGAQERVAQCFFIARDSSLAVI